MTDIRQMTKTEGEAVVAYLREIPAEGRERVTVCDPWTVGHLVAHLTAAGNQTYRNLAKGLVLSRFDLDKLVNRDLKKYLVGSLDERLERFEESVKNPATPGPLREIVLGEMICHGEDIRHGPGIDLICALAGRPYALEQLDGEGLSMLRSRF